MQLPTAGQHLHAKDLPSDVYGLLARFFARPKDEYY